MSTSHHVLNSPVSNFTKIFEPATNEYKTITGQNLGTHQFSAVLEGFNSPDPILEVFRKQVQSFDKSYKGKERLMICLTPIVHVIFGVSATLDDLPFSPAQLIFTGISILLEEAKDVIASYYILADLFERIHLFLQRLKNYTAAHLTPELTLLLGELMAEVLRILALSTEVMKERRIKTFLKRLVGRMDVEDALQRLNLLTLEGNLMTTTTNLQAIHGVRETVTEIRGVDQDVSDDARAIRETSRHINQDVRTVNDNVQVAKQHIGQLQWNQSRERFRTWLRPSNPSKNYNIARNTHHEGTAAWFIGGTIFEEWKKNGSLLWVRGNPGSGKSVLCSAIIEDVKRIQESGSALVAYYYFDFRDVAQRDVRGLLTSILMQLAEASGDCCDTLSQRYADCKNGLERPNETSLIECLESMLDILKPIPVHIIVDALDECPDQSGTPSAREKVLDFVRKLIRTNHSNLFVCITSRPEQDIIDALNSLTSSSCRVSLHEESGQKEDINRFIHAFVHSDRTMRRWREEDKKIVIESLTERAGGMFRWVYCQLDTLRRGTPSSITKVLRELPTTLDYTYERALQGIPKEQRNFAQRLFQCLVAAARPLTAEELAEVFAIDFDSDAGPSLRVDWRPGNPEEALLTACTTLITIVDNSGSKVVQFSHFSVKEYLTSERLRETEVQDIRTYHISTKAAHAVLARTCLGVLLQLDEKVDKQRLASFPLLSYAAQYWVDHARFEELEHQDLITRLFDPKGPYLKAWLWINDIDSNIKRTTDDLDGHPSPPEATPLYYAALCGLRWVTRYLITAYSEDVNAKCGRHGSPLHAASHKGHVAAARVLLDFNADVNVTDRYRKSPLSVAYDGKHAEVIHLLLGRGAKIEGLFDYRGRLLHRASADGKLEVVRLLLRRKADVNAKSDIDWTPLHFASSHGHLEVARLLVEHGANVNAQARDYNTPMHLASRWGHNEIVQLLLDNGAEVHNQGDENSTASMTASVSWYKKIIELLGRYFTRSE